MTSDQQKAFDTPIIGRRNDALTAWTIAPWSFALSFNR